VKIKPIAGHGLHCLDQTFYRQNVRAAVYCPLIAIWAVYSVWVAIQSDSGTVDEVDPRKRGETMGHWLRPPEWKFSAVLRVLPFIGFLITFIQTPPREGSGPLGFLLLATLGAASIAAWLVWSPNSENGE
jgi:hypothetical protein